MGTTDLKITDQVFVETMLLLGIVIKYNNL